jgi:photosystem II stability/assembly factor-like uncharacterized protein
MKILLLSSLLILLSFQLKAQNFWEKLESPASKSLNAVLFLDSLNGWAGGDSALIIHTTDGGESWNTQYSNDSLDILNLCFLNDQIGFASASSSRYEPYGSFLIRTTDGGTNWSAENMRIGVLFVNYVTFLDTSIGFAAGYPGFFLRTTDGGSTWRQVDLDSSIFAGYPPQYIKFYSEDYGFACGGLRDAAGVVWRTSDRGISWQTVVDTSSAPAEPLYTMQIFDSLHVLMMGGDPEYGASTMRTTDGGNSWESSLLGILWYPREVGFRTMSEGWAPLGPRGTFLFTADSGNSWSEIPTPDSVNITNISFPDSLHGFAVGRFGSVIKYVYQEPNSIAPATQRNNAYFLAQNFPNPFNPSTKIEYYIPESGMVRLKIYDILGKEVATLVNSYKEAGSYTINFSTDDLPAGFTKLSSGIYFYRLEAGDYTEVKKMVLLR